MKQQFKVILTGMLVVLLLAGCAKKTPEELIASAKDNIANGDRQTAIVELKNAISSAPKLYEPRILLGEIYLKQSLFEAAEKELLKGLDLGAPDNDVYPNLVKVYYYQNDFDRAINTVARVIVADPNTQSTLILYDFLSKLKNGEITSSFVVPDNLILDHLLIVKAYMAFGSGNMEEASKYISQYQQRDIEIAEKAYLNGVIAKQSGNLEQAVIEFRNVLDEFPNYHSVRFMLIESLMQQKKLDESEKEVDKLLAINKGHALANYYKAAIKFQQKDFEASFNYSQIAREGKLDSLKNNIVHGISAYKLGKYEQAYPSLTRASYSLPKSHSLHRLLAQLQLNLGYRKEAVSTLSGLDNLQDDDALLFEDAAILLAKDGDFASSVEQFSKVNAINESNAKAQLGEGITRLAKNDTSGILNVKKSIEIDPSNDYAWILLAEFFYDNNKPNEALQIAQKWQEIDQLNGLVLEGQIYGRMGEFENAYAAFDRALEIDPEHSPALNAYLMVLRKAQNYDKAYTVALRAVTTSENNGFAAKELILMAQKTDNYAQVEETFKSMLEQFPDEEGPVLMLSSLMRIQDKNKEAAALLERNRSLLSLSGLQSLGDTYFSLDKFNEAKKIYQDWQKAAPDQSKPYLRLYGTEQALGNLENAQTILDQAMQKFPENETVRLLNLHGLMARKQFSRAATEVEFLKRANVTSPLLLLYEGQIEMANKNYLKASKLLEEYYQTNMTFDNAVYLSLAYIGANKIDVAKTIMEEQMSLYPNSIPVKVRVVEFMSVNGFDDEAIAIYRELLDINPNNIMALNNLANTYFKSGQKEKALKNAKLAVDKAPDVPQILDTYGYILLGSGDIEEALNILAVANEKLPEDPEIALHYAEALIASEAKAKANIILSTIKPRNKQQELKLVGLQNKIKG